MRPSAARKGQERITPDLQGLATADSRNVPGSSLGRADRRADGVGYPVGRCRENNDAGMDKAVISAKLPFQARRPAVHLGNGASGL